jgi:exodeoxyribonuclease VII small subunit
LPKPDFPKIAQKPVPKEVSATAAALPPDLSFEAALGELDKIVAAMEAGELPLDESLKAYQRGVALVKAAHARLAAAEQQVRILEEGVLKPLALDEEDE